MFVETQAWIKRYYTYVADINKFMYYNIHTGLWDTDDDTSKLRNLLLDYFSILAEVAQGRERWHHVILCTSMFKQSSTNSKDSDVLKDNYKPC